MVIGTSVGTADRRKMISGDWSQTEKIFKRFELNDEKDFETNLQRMIYFGEFFRDVTKIKTL